MKIFHYLYTLSFLLFISTSCQEVEERGNGLFMTGTSVTDMSKFAIDMLPSQQAVSVTATACVDKDVEITLAVNPNLVEEFNRDKGTTYYPIPEGACEPANTTVTIPAGKNVSSATTLTLTDDSQFVNGRVYLIPVTIVSAPADVEVIEACRTIFLKVSRTIRFKAPDVGSTSMSYQFVVDNPVPSLPVYTWEFRVYADEFRETGSDGVQRVCSFGGTAQSVEGGNLTEQQAGQGCGQNLVRFGEGTDAPDILQLATPQGKLVSVTHFQPKRWYMVSIVNDGSTVTLYIDGKKDNTMNTSAPYDYTFYGIQIGMPRTGYQSSQLFRGRLSEFRIWDKALQATEIAANVCGVDPSSEGLLAYWKMNDGSTNEFKDASPNQRHISYKVATVIKWTDDEINKCVE